jgi:hypothetical protein
MNAQSTNAREKCHENKVTEFHDNVIFHARISQAAPSVCDLVLLIIRLVISDCRFDGRGERACVGAMSVAAGDMNTKEKTHHENTISVQKAGAGQCKHCEGP